MKFTDKERLSIFILGFRLVSYEGKWWIARLEPYGSETLMLGVDAEAGVKGGYFKSPNQAMDSFLKESRRTARVRAMANSSTRRGPGKPSRF